MLNNIKSTKADKGFTIVELLIVIVVIAILAAITIVAYNGIQNRAKTTSAESAASNAAKKAEAYNTIVGSYPTTPGALTGAASTTEYRLDGVAFGTAVPTTAPSNANTAYFYRCGVRASGNNTAPAAVGDIATTTGVRFNHWHWDNNNVTSFKSVGVVSGLVGTQNVGCIFVSA